MPRALVHYFPPEMAVLGLIECALAVAMLYAVTRTAEVPASLAAVLATLAGDGTVVAVVLTVIAGAVTLAIEFYRPQACLDRKHQLTTIGIAAAIAVIGLLFVGGGIPGNLTLSHPLYMAKVVFAWLSAMAMIRFTYSFVMIRAPMSRRVLVIGDRQQTAGVHARLRCRRGRSFEPVVLATPDLCWQLLEKQRIWGVVLASSADASLIEPLLACKLRGVRILGSAAFQEQYLGRIDLELVTPDYLLLGQGFTCGSFSAAVKRACDVSIAICMLILALPLMALTALAIKIDGPGPIFYRQRRIGQFDQPFTLFKFRSMVADAEACGTPRWAQKQDPRITRIGRFLRATRIDELPQLANVICGEMSLVGPRPERPHFVEQLDRAIPFYRHRASVKPGLTGWAQVNFPYGASIEDAREKLAYDLFYVKNRTIVLDLVILISTIRVVLFREGAR
jgi:sugar transferase (PEP-CTERM system associated)